MNRIKRYSAAAVLAGTMLALSVTPSLAQTSPGPGWILIGQDTVSEWYPDPTDANGGKWNLIGVTDRRYFLADGNFSRILNHAVPESGRDNMGISDRVYKAEKILKRTPRDEFDKELKNPNRIYREGNSRVLTRLSRYSLWDDVDFETPWDKFHLFRNKNRALNVFRFQWTDPVVNKVLTQMDPVTEYTPWTYGAVYKDGIAESGIQPGFRTEKQRYVDRDEIVSKLALGVESLTAAAGSRAGLFSGDSGSGAAAPTLEAAKIRTNMGANDAKAADVKASEAEFDAAQASLEELRKQFQESVKAIEEAGDETFHAFKKEIDGFSDKAVREALQELYKQQKDAVKDFSKDLDEKAKEQYAVAKKTGTKVNDYRVLTEKGLANLDARYDQAEATMRAAVERAFAAQKAPVAAATPAPSPTPAPFTGTVAIIQQPVVLPSLSPNLTPVLPVIDEVAKYMGTYKTSMGTTITLTRNGNSNNMKVYADFNGGLEGYKADISSMAFGKSFAVNAKWKNTSYTRRVNFSFGSDGALNISSGAVTGRAVKQK